jgi:hypothetical protein
MTSRPREAWKYLMHTRHNTVQSTGLWSTDAHTEACKCRKDTWEAGTTYLIGATFWWLDVLSILQMFHNENLFMHYSRNKLRKQVNLRSSDRIHKRSWLITSRTMNCFDFYLFFYLSRFPRVFFSYSYITMVYLTLYQSMSSRCLSCLWNKFWHLKFYRHSVIK